MTATMDDRRFQRFGPGEIDASHLAHSSAITVHRLKGPRGPAHVLDDGGGRELAYVKMSRAQERLDGLRGGIAIRGDDHGRREASLTATA
ncbi:MAG TPA: hypothetical protein VHF27_13625 [Acidimicrobiales bacterium]|nr:hypothetical protein [Acidimicrobiales bacterium]